MKNHIEIVFSNITTEISELLVAQLSEIGFEGFEEGDKELKAFIDEKEFDKSVVDDLSGQYGIKYNQLLIPEKNWNAVWESNFQPVVVNDFVGIRAYFHEPVATVEQEIVITPKMSFGTGHHATTYMMIEQMREISFAGRSVLDFGTGTGVLAILAEKLGAKKVLAIDHDEWSITNADENIRENNCSKIELKLADTAATESKFDIILANINRNVILDNFILLSNQLKPGGILLLSGLLKDDEQEIRSASEQFMLVFAGRQEKSNWLCLKFVGKE